MWQRLVSLFLPPVISCRDISKGVIMAYKDLTGQRFGKLIVLGPSDERANGFMVWECQCDCGNSKRVPTPNLTGGRTKSCGCSRFRDLTGRRFGKLTVVRKTETRSNGFIIWECICDCGSTTTVTTNNLTGGTVQSCGCTRFKDLSGKRFGQLLVLHPTQDRRSGHIVWECQCDCGNTVRVTSSKLINGDKTSCGCVSKTAVLEK